MAGYLGNAPTAVPLTSADITDNVITSAKIVDGTITNTDIASSIITGQTAETSIDGADSVLIYDDSATALRKMTRTNFVAGIGATAGQVIQVLSATDTTARTTTSTSYVTASNTLSVTITPSSTANKIFIIVTPTYTFNSSNTLRLTVYRDATNLASNAFVANHTGGTELPLSFSYLDSPNTTSAITYQVYIKTTGGTATLNEVNSISTITCMEVKG